MRQNYDPKKGLKNVDEMYNEIGSNHVQVNSVRIIRNQDPQPRSGIAWIEELPVEKQKIAEATFPYLEFAKLTFADVNSACRSLPIRGK